MPKDRGARRVRPASLVCLLVCLLACLLVGACTVTPAPAAVAPHDGRPRVVATFTVLADIVRVVGGEDVVVTSVTRPGSEIHGYEPTPDDLRRAAGADLLVVNGLGLETWVERLVEPLNLPSVVLTDGMSTVPIGDSDAVNPHAWMSPRQGVHYVRAVQAALTDLLPTAAGRFRARADAYVAELEALHTELMTRLAEVPVEHRVLVTCEGAFSYLARDAGLAELYLWPVNAERQGTPRQVARVVLEARAARVPAVFCESTVPPTAAQQVARETGARFGGVLHVDSLTGPDGPAPTYLDLLRHDVDVVVRGLTGGAS